MLTVNEYFNGKVKSIAFKTSTLPATVGVMVKGDYTFSTSQKEYMTVVSGELQVKLSGSEKYVSFEDGQTFIVEANQSFDLHVPADTAYFCRYE